MLLNATFPVFLWFLTDQSVHWFHLIKRFLEKIYLLSHFLNFRFLAACLSKKLAILLLLSSFLIFGFASFFISNLLVSKGYFTSSLWTVFSLDPSESSAPAGSSFSSPAGSSPSSLSFPPSSFLLIIHFSTFFRRGNRKC